MKLLKKVILVFWLVGINSNIQSSDAAHAAQLVELSKEIDQMRTGLPKFKAELYRQYPNPNDGDGKEVHGLFNTIEASLVPLAVKELELARKDPWILSEDKSILQVARTGLSEPSPEELDAGKIHKSFVEVVSAYKKELDKRHPKHCSSCRSWRHPFGRCSQLHQHYNELVKPLVQFMATIVVIHSRDPEVLLKARSIHNAIKASSNQTVQETKTPD